MHKNASEIVHDAESEQLSNDGTNVPEPDPQLPDQHLLKCEENYIPGRGIQRYNNSLKNLIPVRRKGKEKGTMPIDSAGLFSYISISWFSQFMYKACRKELIMEELPRVSPSDTCNYNAERLELLWKDELARKGPKNASLSTVSLRFCRTRLLAALLIQILCVTCGILSSTVLMRKLLEYVQSGTGSYGEGVKWVLLMTAAETARTLCWTWARLLSFTTALRLRSACLTLVYRKIINVNCNLGNKNIGEVINIVSVDAERIYEAIYAAPLIIEAPISTIYAVAYVLMLFNPMALFGILAFVFYYPIQYVVSQLIGHFQAKLMKISDTRVRLTNEILDCIKLIKMYAWEESFCKKLLGTRKTECQSLLKIWYGQIVNIAIGTSIPVVSTVLTFLAYVSAGNNLTAAKVFPYAAFLDSRIRFSVIDFRLSLDSIVTAGISINRIKSLLLAEDGECTILKPVFKSQAVAISNGTFGYNRSVNDDKDGSQTNGKVRNGRNVASDRKGETEKLNEPTAKYVDVLFNVTFEAEKGKLVGICGQIGSGKSSLLLAALGQLRRSEGRVARDGSCAYVSQQAWITNATLRENILFGEKFDRARYRKAIYACNLIQDIDMMPGGDRTEIGEKGVNLSGGQKQRVALARALYADRDIYFLDDPLSAVDSRVGAHIFDNLILGALKGKTILFVTHQIQYLNRCDDVYMMHNGRIIQHGTHDELMKLRNDYALMVVASSDNEKTEDQTTAYQKIDLLPQSIGNSNEAGATGKISNTEAENNEMSKSDAIPLTAAENIQQGSVTTDTYRSYIAAMGGYCYALVVICMFIFNIGSASFSSWWLALWIKAGGGNKTIVRNNETIFSDNINDNPDFSYYQSIYLGSIGIVLFASTTYGLVFARATIGASTELHNDLFQKIISSPMRFFDTTPIGRIQHLFSRDMNEVDSKLPSILMIFLQIAFRMIFILLSICLVFPAFILPLSILSVVYYYTSRSFRVTIRDMKRMENRSRAPVISFVTATVQGLSTIRAFGRENNFTAKFVDLFDENSSHVFMFSAAVAWLALRMEILSVLITCITAFMVIAFRDQVPVALAGLALTYAVQASGVLPFVMTYVLDTEVRFIGVERIRHYTRTLVIEGSTDRSTLEPPSIWPQAAEIKFKNVCMAYGDDAPFILKNVSFAVHAGEKIGIVGRTGSGKSSLTIALFRLVELAEGKIEIDDVDISEISLSQLRTKLSIIPQDPVLFSGTIRSNLDPFKLYTDAEIWEALEKTELKARVQSINGQLEAPVEFGGDNWSVGERQLICLARALLRNSKILVLDEATAAVDPETEIAVQNTIQREFSHCTILTIAHRLQTVLSLSRVLVMDDGEVLEYDSASELLKNQNSEFSKMMAIAKQVKS